MRTRRRFFRSTRAAAVACVAAIALASCTSSSPAGKTGTSGTPTSVPQSSAVPAASGGTATWAEQPLAAPNYIFPINSCCFSVANLSDFQELMYRPLYWFGTAGQPTLNTTESLADPPTYRGDTVLVKLKPGLQWSNGEPVDAADVIFFMNMLKTVAPVDWGGYSPGYFPDNVKSVVAVGKMEVKFTLTGSYGSTWFTYNELSQITPFPIGWDVTGRNAQPGSGGCSKALYSKIAITSTKGQPIVPTSAGARACFNVYNFLANAKTGQAAAPNTYANNPLWAIVDGPWKLASIDTNTGNTDFVPNPMYNGPQKPRLAHFDEVGFQTAAAEYQALNTGSGPDVGYVTPADVAPASNPLVAGQNAKSLAGKYTFALDYPFSINYFPVNLANPTAGPIFKQLYARQALQFGIDQQTIIRSFDAGYGVPTVGPVPTVPPTYESNQERTPPYAFNPAKGKALLESHGWTIPAGGAAVCTRPGTGANECGAGVSRGAKFAFTMLWANGDSAFENEVKLMAADWAREGIRVTLKGEELFTVDSTAGINCFTSGDCSWQAANWGGGWLFSPDYLPTGEEIFGGGQGCSTSAQLVVSNVGAYCDATNDANIRATTRSNQPSVLHAYEDYLTTHLPVLWQPVTPVLREIKLHLEGVTPFNVFEALNPEYWGWQSGFVSNT